VPRSWSEIAQAFGAATVLPLNPPISGRLTNWGDFFAAWTNPAFGSSLNKYRGSREFKKFGAYLERWYAKALEVFGGEVSPQDLVMSTFASCLEAIVNIPPEMHIPEVIRAAIAAATQTSAATALGISTDQIPMISLGGKVAAFKALIGGMATSTMQPETAVEIATEAVAKAADATGATPAEVADATKAPATALTQSAQPDRLPQATQDLLG